MNEIRHIQIRSFVLGGNHGQYLQAAGLAKLTNELRPKDRVSHARYSNHIWRELKVQVIGLHLPKYLAMRLHWLRRIKFSALGEPADIRLYGSDQIWSFSNGLFAADPTFFGRGDDAWKIAYGPSMGFVPEGFTLPDWACESLSQFRAIGARDEATASAVERALGLRPEIVVDPAFFLRRPFAEPQVRRNVLAVYGSKVSHMLPAILNSGDRIFNGWKTEIYGYLPRRQTLTLIGNQFLMPEAVLGRIAQAKLLYTSTFHGVVMALMMGTPFVALMSPSLIDRLASPLGRTTFGAHRLVTEEVLSTMDRRQIERLLDGSDIDFPRIANLIDQSKNWLARALPAQEELS